MERKVDISYRISTLNLLRRGSVCPLPEQGKMFWRMHTKGQPLEGYPIDTSRFWDQLPSKVDAAYERIDSKIIFFKGALDLCFDRSLLLCDF